MGEPTRICSKADLPAAGEAREIEVGYRKLCLANVDGVIRAVDNVCPHREGPLGQGIVERGRVICPWHGWAFDLKTGVSTHSKESAVAVYKVEVEGNDVLALL